MLDTPTALGGAISGLALGDVIDFAGATISSLTCTGSTLSVVIAGVTHDYQVGPLPAGAVFRAWGGRITVTQPLTPATLTTGVDKVTAPGVLIAATAGALSTGDIITPGGTGNVIQLNGGGVFNLAKPKTLTNVAEIDATEGAGTALPTITLRKGVNVTLNLATGTGVGSGAKIVGALDSSIINLGGGTNVVTLGSATETVHGGAGKDTFNVTALTIGATIDGGTGASTLNVTGGGAVVMGSSITNVKAITLATATNFTANGLNLTVSGSTGIDTIRAGSGVQTITGRGGADTLISGAGPDTFKDTRANLGLATIQGFKAADTIDVTNLKPSKTVPTKATWAAGVLTVKEGATTVLIKLPGDFTGTFSTASDGAAGTAITYAPHPAALAQAMAALGASASPSFLSPSLLTTSSQGAPFLLAPHG